MIKHLPRGALVQIIFHKMYSTTLNPLLDAHFRLSEQNERNPNLTHPHPFHSPIMEQLIYDY